MIDMKYPNDECKIEFVKTVCLKCFYFLVNVFLFMNLFKTTFPRKNCFLGYSTT